MSQTDWLLIEQKYFTADDLEVVEWLTMANRSIGPKEKELLIGIMSFLRTRNFITGMQKANVHRLVKKYHSEYVTAVADLMLSQPLSNPI